MASIKGKGKSPTQAKPATTVARSAELRKLEEGERNFNFIVKKLESAGPNATIEALRAFQNGGYDASEHSQQAVVGVNKLDDWIEHSDAFSGRKVGAIAPETVFLEQLMEKFPHENAEGLWSTLRTVAENQDHRHNPTPGICPFTHKFDARGKPVIHKRGKLYPYRTFRNALSAIRRRKARAST